MAVPVASFFRTRLRRARQGLSLLAIPARQPRFALGWLAGAREAQVALAAGLLFVWLGLPPLLDASLPGLYPDITTETKLLGLFKQHKSSPDPRLARRRQQLLVLGGTAAGATVLLLLLAQLPATVHRASKTGEPGTSSANTIVSPVSAPGQAPDRYRLDEELARGGMGAVYRGHDQVLGRPIALKQLRAEFAGTPDLVERFRQEARALARLTHPNIVQVHDLVQRDDRWWIVMELIDGGDLGDLLHQEGPLTPTHVAQLAEPVARALGCAHEHGVVHRDVKPENVLLTVDQIPKLTDFGLAKLLESGGSTQVGSVLGSPAYMSPEQAAGEPADESSDIYSLGVTLYEMLVGHVPFAGDTSAVLAKHITGRPEALRDLDPAIPESLEQLVLEMLRKDKFERPSDMTLVGDRLLAFSKA
jgi:predicted Ser/Thr protein kinase